MNMNIIKKNMKKTYLLLNNFINSKITYNKEQLEIIKHFYEIICESLKLFRLNKKIQLWNKLETLVITIHKTNNIPYIVIKNLLVFYIDLLYIYEEWQKCIFTSFLLFSQSKINSDNKTLLLISEKIGKCYKNINNLEKSLIYFYKMLFYSLKLNNYRYELISYDYLGLTYFNLGNLNEATMFHDRLINNKIEKENDLIKKTLKTKEQIIDFKNNREIISKHSQNENYEVNILKFLYTNKKDNANNKEITFNTDTYDKPSQYDIRKVEYFKKILPKNPDYKKLSKFKVKSKYMTKYTAIKEKNNFKTIKRLKTNKEKKTNNIKIKFFLNHMSNNRNINKFNQNIQMNNIFFKNEKFDFKIKEKLYKKLIIMFNKISLFLEKIIKKH